MKKKDFNTLIDLWIEYDSLELIDTLLFLERDLAIDDSKEELIRAVRQMTANFHHTAGHKGYCKDCKNSTCKANFKLMNRAEA